MKKRVAGVAASCSLVLALMSAPAGAATGQPGCFGDFASFFAQNPQAFAAFGLGTFANLGQFVKSQAQLPGPYGRLAIPVFKTDASILGCE